MESNLIVVKQLPVIEQRLREVKAENELRVEKILHMVCTEDTVKSIKKMRAELSKEFQAFEDQRKDVKRQVAAPYEAFEKVYKECVSDVYREADAQLKTRIADVEYTLKKEKTEEVERYFNEYRDSLGIDFLVFGDIGILIDCGVSFAALRGVYKDLKLVLLTHIHTDHIKKTTIKALAAHRPTLKFACGPWLAESLVGAGVSKRNIHILQPNLLYPYPGVNVIPVQLTHNVPNYGYKLHFPGCKVFYATDTGNLDGITAWHYDLYMVEANYEDGELMERLKRKRSQGLYPYEEKVICNHLSKKQCDSFLYANMGPKSQYIYMHQHEGGEDD